ncbi:hypothetical protein MAXJ12_26753 [Mesorhizobium alhagi CCNWXJ12-2]|uniref:Uncharacterized protein n=1 Tax=Mesorhizobium alhagi CCNWXJ12-2 TaxID=1107882 RepID=H0HYR6_9HYPH|nr:hypothetical protein MAXJ12_26753 [Mesorhizobium alhagi CCNWXJ12-2]
MEPQVRKFLYDAFDLLELRRRRRKYNVSFDIPSVEADKRIHHFFGQEMLIDATEGYEQTARLAFPRRRARAQASILGVQ